MKESLRSAKKHGRVYKAFFKMYLKSRLIYKTDFILGFTSQTVNLIFSVEFLGLLFTQIESLSGWTFNEILLLAGFSGLILNLHHTFFFALYKLGETYIIQGELDRYLVRPLNVLFQVFARYVAEDNLSKFLANIIITIYAMNQLSLSLTWIQAIYSFAAILSGVMIIGSIFLVLGSTAFWTGRSQAVFWLFFRLSDFRRYPYDIFSTPIQLILISLVPIAFSSFFPTTFILGMDEWWRGQIAALVVGPIFYLIGYRFWLYGLKNYSSTGS